MAPFVSIICCVSYVAIENLFCDGQADKKRSKIMRSGTHMGAGAAAKALDIDDPEETEELRKAYSAAHFDMDDLKLRELDLSMKSVSDAIQNDITKLVLCYFCEIKFSRWVGNLSFEEDNFCNLRAIDF